MGSISSSNPTMIEKTAASPIGQELKPKRRLVTSKAIPLNSAQTPITVTATSSDRAGHVITSTAAHRQSSASNARPPQGWPNRAAVIADQADNTASSSM